jgi:hypothetical protein
VGQCIWIHSTLTTSQWKIVAIMFHKLLVRLFVLSLSTCKSANLYYQIIDLESLTVRRVGKSYIPNAMIESPMVCRCRLYTVSHPHVEYFLLPLDPLRSTDPPRTGRTHMLFSVDDVVLFSASLVAVSCLAFFIMCLPRLCGIVEKMEAASV